MARSCTGSLQQILGGATERASWQATSKRNKRKRTPTAWQGILMRVLIGYANGTRLAVTQLRPIAAIERFEFAVRGAQRNAKRREIFSVWEQPDVRRNGVLGQSCYVDGIF